MIPSAVSLPLSNWPYLPILERLGLALALGLFVGFERERRHKEAGLRTFAFAALLGALGGLLGEHFALLSLLLLGVLATFLNLQTLRANQGTELTTSAALLVTGYAGILTGQGHTLTPAAVAVITAAMLAWKEPLAGFSTGLSETELRSAILLAIFAFVIYPALPEGTIGPWGLIEPRAAWITVILIAGIGFVNYILWNVYGSRGAEVTGFLGGLVNSTVTVQELALRVNEAGGGMAAAAQKGILLATGAMVIRNAVLLGIIAPRVFPYAVVPFALMLLASALFAFTPRRSASKDSHAPSLHLKSPFRLSSALKYGLLFLALQVAGTLAQRSYGQVGVYLTSFFGGLFSSANAVAATASLAANGTISNGVAGTSAVLASLMSVLVRLPLVARSKERAFAKRVSVALVIIAICGIAGAVLQTELIHLP